MARLPGLVVGVAELRRHPGTRREVDLVAASPGLGLSASRVPEGAELHVHAVLESLTDGLTATGTVRGPWVGECRRCLREVRGELDAPFREVFEAAAVEGETYELAGDHVDLEPMVRDVVLLALPLAPLCDDDCAGPAPEAFPTVVGEAREPGGDEAEPARDPRWAALDDLRFE
jgi:uncharacterized protein